MNQRNKLTNLNLYIMTTLSKVNDEILNKVSQMMTNQILIDAELLEIKNLTPNWFDSMLDIVLESVNISFESKTAENTYKTAIAKTMDRKAYELVFPKMGMDQNGNYTKNQSLWA